MKDSVRRIVMLCTILTFGLILVFFDVTIVQLLLMMVILVIVLPFLLGSVTVAEVRTALLGVKKTGILRRLDEMKFFEKGTSPPAPKAPPKPDKAPPKPVKPESPKIPEKSGGIGAHLKSIVTSLGSLGTILSQRSKREKKIEDINKMLDKTVSEKVTKSPAPAGTPAAGKNVPLPSGGGAGMAAEPGTRQTRSFPSPAMNSMPGSLRASMTVQSCSSQRRNPPGSPLLHCLHRNC